MLYPVIIWIYSLFIKKPVDEIINNNIHLNKNLSISLIISAYNEENVILQKLNNCLTLNYPTDKMEIIIASDGSTDETNSIVSNFDSDRIKFIDLPRMGKVNVINEIVPEASGKILVFSDANTIYDCNAIIELVKYFNKKQIGCVCGNLKLVNPTEKELDGESSYWKYEKWIKNLESKLGIVVGANGAIYAIRKKLFESLPPTTINDDFHISMKIFDKGYDVVFSEKAIGKEYIAKNFHAEFKRHIRDGAGHYREMAHFISLLSVFRGKRFFSYFSHRVIRWLVPFLLILIFLLNIVLLPLNYFMQILIAQITFYFIILFAFIMKSFQINIGILNLPLFFISTNVALLIGFIKNILGKQSVQWESTERII